MTPSNSGASNAAHHQAASGDAGGAEEIYRNALRENPDDIGILTELARALEAQGRMDEAIALFQRVVALRPDVATARTNLALVLCRGGYMEQGFAIFQRHTELVYGKGGVAASDGDPTTPHKIQHDREQRDYLVREKGLALPADAQVFNIEDGVRVAGRAVRLDASGDVIRQWQTNAPQVVVIDNFLTGEALEKLRRYCWGSTIWRKIYANGYLGAMQEHGIGSPLLAQIDEELRSAYPEIIKQHPLLHFWGFKYDQKLQGVALHADFAALNVNFWIAPDDANLDPQSGGLIVWDKPAPLDWDFSKYNNNVGASRAFLVENGAKPIKIPHRANRAVIFDSDLFHETDKINFKEGYINRRINITMLYGKRESA